jgi:hypothetical protein
LEGSGRVSLAHPQRIRSKGHDVTRQAPPPHTTLPAAGTLVVEEPRFALVPEWVIDAAVSDGAFRLYSLLDLWDALVIA